MTALLLGGAVLYAAAIIWAALEAADAEKEGGRDEHDI